MADDPPNPRAVWVAMHPVLGGIALGLGYAAMMITAGVAIFQEPFSVMLWFAPLFAVGFGVPMAILIRRRVRHA